MIARRLLRVASTFALILACFANILPATASDGGKKLPEALGEIRDAKARGERYLGMTWHAAEELHRNTHEEAMASKARLARAGGSHSGTATLVVTNPYQDQGTTVGMGNDSVDGGCTSGGSDTSEDAWYRLDLSNGIVLEAWTTCESTGGSSFDTRISVFDENLVLVACNDDAPDCGQPYFQSRISDLLLDQGTYFVVVDGYNGNAGNYELNVTWTDAPVVCEGSDSSNATTVDTLPFVATDTTVDACDAILVDCELQTGSSGPDKWYRLDVDTSVLLDVRTVCDALDLDSRLAILDASLTTIYCNDDDPLCASHQSEIEGAYLDPGIYYVVVDSPEGSGGMFTVEMDTTHAPVGEVRDLLPDIDVITNDLYDNVVVDDVVPGRVHLRLSNATANLGEGKLYLYGVNPGQSASTHEVRQRIWRSDGTWYDRAAGQFVYHPGHNHIHIEGWAQYNLREILPGDGVGPILASGTKTSFCIIDLRVQDSSLPNHPPSGEFHACDSTIQGLSVGWADIYSKGLVDQWIDITDVPDGTYWLESVADPANHIAELDETNNVARIQVTVGAPAPINPDPFEPNPDVATVQSRPSGQNNSPNLGPCGPQRTIGGLTIHESGDDDVFMFYLPAPGGSEDFVQIDFVHAQGDLDMRLLDDAGFEVANSQGTSDSEVISLDGRSAGWYFVQVYGYSGATHPSYSLTVDPSSNTAPTLAVTSPPVEGVELVQAIDAYSVTWTSDDVDGNETWASVWVNTVPEFDGNEFFLETSLHTPAELGLYILSTTYLDVGTYHVYVQVTDGGSTTGAWSPGTMTLVPQATDAPTVITTTVSRLLPAVPNPFNPRTTLRLELSRHVDALSWNVYDLRGALVRTLPAGHMHAGLHTRVWNGRDDNGRSVASGVYLSVVRGGGLALTQKLLLVE